MTDVADRIEVAAPAETREPIADAHAGQGAFVNHVLWWAWYLPADLAREYRRRWSRAGR